MADILIKSMEMPKVCKECRFCDYREYGQYIGEDSGMHCYALFKKIFKLDTEARRQRYPNCPLVEVKNNGYMSQRKEIGK